MGKRIDITGNRFGRLVAIRPTEERLGNSIKWLCKCDCGKECIVASIHLRKGSTTSCGCVSSEVHKNSVKKAKDIRNAYVVENTDVMMISNQKLQSNNTSGCKGVSFDSSVNLWKAYITFKGTRYYLGGYREKEDAIAARKEAEKKVYGPFLEWYADKYPEKWKRINKG